ncbi:MAG: flavin reductase [Peptococcaceae bacterium]|jgi:flavin reductase (DIM6/NTAB) family NADH-FMN oxidoreductase RutF/rubredoxin|nr:flavin reductase [Peptococcaceae bacterium]
MDKTALYQLTHGVYIVGVKMEKGFGGCVVDAVAQITSGEPPVLILSSMRKNLTNTLIKEAGEFTLSVLGETVDPFAVGNFGLRSGREADKWACVPHRVKDGLPTLDGAVAYARCRVTEAREFPTHTAFFCEVVDAWKGEKPDRPLIYGDYQKNMRDAAVAALRKFAASSSAPASAPSPVSAPSAPSPAQPASPPQTAQGEKWRCEICGYVYDGDIPFSQLPADWTCLVCGVAKDQFEKIAD